ncbi:MAG: Fic family protein [Candidatus Pacebacteria bacterium]|nr:Fic family protein [Candidatus Paceibacterota bacterium]
MFNPGYKLTNSMVKNLTSIAEGRVVIEKAKILPMVELKLRRQAIIRMTHSSTAIEGNRLISEQVAALYADKKVDAPERDIYEVKNYIAALKYIEKVVKRKNPISEKVLLMLHKLVTDKTLKKKEQSGAYRKSPVYVVKKIMGEITNVVYTAPDFEKVPELCADLIGWIEKSEKEEVNPVLVAGIVHQEMVAIHPFADGNGRTARAMATLILYKRGYDFRKLFALEDYYNEDRPSYYEAINLGKNYEERKNDFTSWLEYFIKGFKEEIDTVKNQVLTLASKKTDKRLGSQVFLDKDQLKIIDFIDQMGRITAGDVVDILSCPKRTAQLHLQKLKKIKMIKQVGKGRASAYVLNKG